MKVMKMELHDLDEVAELFVMQAIHVKNLNDPYCDNNAEIDGVELNKNFKNHFSSLMNNNEALVVIAKEDGKIVGFAIGTIIQCRVPGFISKIEKVGYIDEAYVDVGFRRKGVLRELEAGILKFFKEHNLRYVELNYFNSNRIAKASWNALGYRTYMEYARKEI
jgi:ribosomal protein S18 acetylase RimI-like enzyme